MHETQAILESMCYDGMGYSNVDDMWDLFESLAWYQWQCESARDSFHHYSSYSHVMCSYCQSFNHDVNSYAYYDVFDECYAKLDAMIGTINEEHKHFISEMRECALLHGTDPSLAFPRLEAGLFDDYESSYPQESNLVNETPFTDLEEALDPPLTSSSLIVPSSRSTPIGTTISALTLPASPLPVARCTWLEMGEHSRDEANFIEDAMIT